MGCVGRRCIGRCCVQVVQCGLMQVDALLSTRRGGVIVVMVVQRSMHIDAQLLARRGGVTTVRVVKVREVGWSSWCHPGYGGAKWVGAH